MCEVEFLGGVLLLECANALPSAYVYNEQYRKSK